MSKNIWGKKELAKWYWLLKYDMHIRVASWDNLFLQGKIKWRETVASEKKKRCFCLVMVEENMHILLPKLEFLLLNLST